MKTVNKNIEKVKYIRDSTSASVSFGPNSSASEDNLSYMLRNGLQLIAFDIQNIQQQIEEPKKHQENSA
jgi:hypothetical protein